MWRPIPAKEYKYVSITLPCSLHVVSSIIQPLYHPSGEPLAIENHLSPAPIFRNSSFPRAHIFSSFAPVPLARIFRQQKLCSVPYLTIFSFGVAFTSNTSLTLSALHHWYFRAIIPNMGGGSRSCNPHVEPWEAGTSANIRLSPPEIFCPITFS